MASAQLRVCLGLRKKKKRRESWASIRLVCFHTAFAGLCPILRLSVGPSCLPLTCLLWDLAGVAVLSTRLLFPLNPRRASHKQQGPPACETCPLCKEALPPQPDRVPDSPQSPLLLCCCLEERLRKTIYCSSQERQQKTRREITPRGNASCVFREFSCSLALEGPCNPGIDETGTRLAHMVTPGMGNVCTSMYYLLADPSGAGSAAERGTLGSLGISSNRR